jgi:starch synthase
MDFYQSTTALVSADKSADRRLFVEKMSSFVLQLLKNSSPALTGSSFTENKQVAERVMELNLADTFIDEGVMESSSETPVDKMKAWLETDFNKVDWSVCPVDLSAAETSKYYAELLRADLAFASDTQIRVVDGVPYFIQSFRLTPQILDDADFYLHWGMKDSQWWSQEIKSKDIKYTGGETFLIEAKILAELPGEYRVTLYAKHAHSSELIWLGAYEADDLSFRILPKKTIASMAAKKGRQSLNEKNSLESIIASYESFAGELKRQKRTTSYKAFGREVFQQTSQNAILREKLNEHLAHAKSIIATSSDPKEKKNALEVILLLQRLGIGEIVLVAPEGPHASAGGLSQVITGLLHTLSSRDIHATLISPLYENENGKRHRSADDVIRDGFFLGKEKLQLELAGEVSVKFGGTFNDGVVSRFPLIVPVEVYLAQKDNLRIFLLRQRRLADSLYRNVWADEQIRRAVFMGRGALEVMSNPEFGITPHLVISNDWMTGLVPALMQVDENYSQNPALKEAQTIHIIHNGGQGYQGRFAATQFGEDLYPLLSLRGTHFLGLSDPHDRAIMNFTAAAVYHVRNAILTVSQPYAEELLTAEGGEGLESLFRRRRRILFGISNGIDRLAIRRIIWELGFLAIRDEKKAYRYRDALWTRRLPALKKVLKTEVQHRFGLNKAPNAPLICLVGRLAEQKGIGLLVGETKEKISVLSSLLKENPDLQILICGPLSEGDPIAKSLEKHLLELTKLYPGRISGSLEFAPHRDALEIAAASDLFLMPSRYEPGGLTQLEALAVGTPVVARNVGGLQATLKDALKDTEKGNSFLFKEYDPIEFHRVVTKALKIFYSGTEYDRLVLNAAEAEHDWSDRIPSYLALFRFIAGVSEPFRRYSFLADEVLLVEAIRASRV